MLSEVIEQNGDIYQSADGKTTVVVADKKQLPKGDFKKVERSSIEAQAKKEKKEADAAEKKARSEKTAQAKLFLDGMRRTAMTDEEVGAFKKYFNITE